MKDIGRWLPWVLPGSTGRFYKDDIVHNHSAYGYYNPHKGRGKMCMMLLHVKQNKTKLSKKCHHYKTRIGSSYSSYERQFEWWNEQNRCTYVKKLQVRGASCKCCSRSQQRSRIVAHIVSAVSLDRTCMVNITFSYHFFFCSALDIRQSTFHTPVIEKVAGPRDICQAVLTAIFRAVPCNNSSSVFLNHSRTLHTKQRRGSKASWFRTQCHEGSKTSSRVMTPLV